MNSDSRYEGKPLLRLLELYVLKTIDELSESEAKTLESMTPKLRATYGVSGTWDEVIAAVAGLTDDVSIAIRKMWLQNLNLAKDRGVELTPQRFSEMFVDANLR